MLWHFGGYMIEHPNHVFLTLTNRKPADGISVELNLLEILQALAAQILKHAALHDAEEL